MGTIEQETQQADPIEAARRPLMDALAQAFAVYGWPEILGRLFGQLYLLDRAVSQDELCERLNVSKASVSTNLRTLENLHMVHRVTGPGVDNGSGRPRIYFQAERDFMKVAQELLRHNARRELEVMSRGLDESRSRLEALRYHPEGDVAAQAAHDLAAVDRFDGYRRWANRILWLVQSGERMQHFISGLWTKDTP
ncbi:MAG: hypothetical protein R2873_12035 [Caldilineaceae bacterium]|nr:hypothetical protein [Caldilineaceae bacterium]